jgi:primosomal protein N' (replication factor Y)
MLRLTRWLVDYYLCPWGKVLEAVVPAAVRGQAGTRRVQYVSLAPPPATGTGTADSHPSDEKPPRLTDKQYAILELLKAAARPLSTAHVCQAIGCTISPIHNLRAKGLVVVDARRVLRDNVEEWSGQQEHAVELNADQQAAVGAALEALRGSRYETLLLHGVTGSGKTEVYIRAFQEVVGYGRQAIILVPEISLTPQTVQRFRARFERVAVLHSHLSPAERHWHWQRIARGEVDVIVGARSAVFAPAPQLGLIVIDEEHDGSFKQDQMPRYHAREVAIERARAERIPLILGSATPSLESWHRAHSGEFRLLSMPRRVMDLPLPHVSTIDLRLEFQNRFTRGAIGRQLHQAITETLTDRGQVILLLNRRGFSTHIQCPACGGVVRCKDCDIALTHHRAEDVAVCHYCDYQTRAPLKCPECGFEGIRYGGLGTQRLEAEVKGRFPQANCLRMDSDTMRKPGSHQEALNRFRAGEIQILLGTQMIAKGLDFPNVTLVGVINADTGLHLPDFRAAERTFQLVTQVAGRTGRGARGGRVLVQTFSPDHYAIETATRHDFLSFALIERQHRENFGYPPFGALARAIVRSESEVLAQQFAEQLAEFCKTQLAQQPAELAERARVLGPAAAPIAKLRGHFRFHLLLQGPRRELLQQVSRAAQQQLQPPAEVLWLVDIDPYDMQ